MSPTVAIIRDLCPEAGAVLTVEQVARVLGRTGAGAYEQTRDELAAGKIIKGLGKRNGRWSVPIGALADAIDSVVTIDDQARATPRPATHRTVPPASASPAPAPQAPRGRKTDAARARERLEREQRLKAIEFWGEAFAHYDLERLAAILQ
jgi:pyruvate/2-oxoglutarate dehydrogenase complex dihydrolipoamide acyltransferase (E2) component